MSNGRQVPAVVSSMGVRHPGMVISLLASVIEVLCHIGGFQGTEGVFPFDVDMEFWS